MARAPFQPMIHDGGSVPVSLSALAADLVRHGHLPAEDARAAEETARRLGTSLAEVLVERFHLPQAGVARAFARLHGTRVIDPQAEPSDAALLAAVGPDWALRHEVLPWRRLGAVTLVLTTDPERFHSARTRLSSALGPVRMALTTRDHLTRAVAETAGSHLLASAETRVAQEVSIRSWKTTRARGVTVAALFFLLAVCLLSPAAVAIFFCALAILILAAQTGLKLAALRSQRPRGPSRVAAQVLPARLPVVSILIPLHRETAVADHLLRRLAALDYPRELLDVCLVMEESDQTTRTVIGQTALSTWMRVIVVPDSTLKTKPRALNFALPFTRGSIIGVYDAEDAPAPDQLHKVARHFAGCPADVACLQGRLDYYNAGQNWLTRCFALEYAGWFRILLPGLDRLGLVVPLGGTTLFIRKPVLEAIGGWDAHNVTEDADLGVRLCRHGYRTELIDTTTREEATDRIWPWVRQRSRWLKGYAMTYLVHMRAPRQLWRDLGARRFWGVQLLFGGTLLQFLLAPFLWSFWVLPLGLPHPIAGLAPSWLIWCVAAMFLTSEAVNIGVGVAGAKRAGKRWLIPWLLTTQAYYPLATLAAWKGMWELLWRPFYWDKTTHGRWHQRQEAAATPPPRPWQRPASNGSQRPG